MGSPEGLRIAIIGGTGLGELLLEEMDPSGALVRTIETPFGAPSAAIVTGEIEGAPVALLQRHGAGHMLAPAQVPSRANVYALKSLGCTHVVATGATGSLREAIAPGDLVLCDQLIDRTEGRPRTFFENAAVHVEFADPFCPVMRRWLLGAAERLDGTRLHPRGTYVCMEGPSFSTRAESHLYRAWGADVVGMTALPEARLAREAEMAYALVALPTDWDCWRRAPGAPGASSASGEVSAPESLLEEIRKNLRKATQASIDLIRRALGDVGSLRRERSPAHDALRLAIWSDREQIPREEIERLRVLWGRYVT